MSNICHDRQDPIKLCNPYLVRGCQPRDTSGGLNSSAAGCPCIQAARWGCRAAEESACHQGHGASPDGIHKGHSNRPLSAVNQALDIAAWQQLLCQLQRLAQQAWHVLPALHAGLTQMRSTANCCDLKTVQPCKSLRCCLLVVGCTALTHS